MLRVYLYGKWKSPKIELLVYNAPFTKTLIELNKSENEYNAIVDFEGETLIVRRSCLGNRVCPRTINQFSTLCLAKVINLEKKEELSKLLDKNDRYFSKKVNVRVMPKEWGVKFHEFFSESPEEQKLVSELSGRFSIRNITAKSTNSSMYGNADIVVSLKNKEIPIELTALMPAVQKKEIRKGGNAPHGSKWAKVAAKILTLLLYTVRTGNPSIVLIHDSWKKYQHTSELQESLKKANCFLIYTSFKDNWAKIFAEQFESLCGEERCCVLESNQAPTRLAQQ